MYFTVRPRFGLLLSGCGPDPQVDPLNGSTVFVMDRPTFENGSTQKWIDTNKNGSTPFFVMDRPTFENGSVFFYGSVFWLIGRFFVN